MKPWKTLARATDGRPRELVLQERDGNFVIRAGGQVLMSSATHGSEEVLADFGLGCVSGERPHILLGGLGMGFTLRAALQRLPPSARVLVAECSASVVEWNQTTLADLAGAPLADLRVEVLVDDVGQVARTHVGQFDAILLDVDNGPSAVSREENQLLYGRSGLGAFRESLREGGALTVWSAGPDGRFARRLEAAGFRVEERRVPARTGSRTQHTLFRARRVTSLRYGSTASNRPRGT